MYFPHCSMTDLSRYGNSVRLRIFDSARLSVGNPNDKVWLPFVPEQNPDVQEQPGTMVLVGSSVNLVVSSGPPPTVSVPNVTGATQAEATTTINAAGLVLGTVTTASSTTIVAGLVISENPGAGSLVTVGSAVALVVSSGKPQVAVPPSLT
jgi:beta-lactam-binding protein with PASTA domain